jgi:pyruvate carboxylase
MVLNVNTAAVGASATTEAGIGMEMAAAVAVAAEALTGVLPMGADLDSVQFAAAVNATGAAYIGTAIEHLTNRGQFAEAQNLAAATYTATEAVNDTALSL